VTLTDEMENREAEYYLQAFVLKSGVCDFVDRWCMAEVELIKETIAFMGWVNSV